jgi:hypothetical protein
MPSKPGGRASAPESAAARAAALRANARAAAPGASTACSRLAGTPPTTDSTASTTDPKGAVGAEIEDDKVMDERSRLNAEGAPRARSA